MNDICHKTEGLVSFAVGTGRCGTKFLSEVISLEPEAASVHERNPLNETFHRYCKWYGLPIDHEGFLQTKESEIQQDLKTHSRSFEASAYLSLSLQELYDRFQAKFILLVRRPDKVVNSYLRKGWYSQPAVRANPHLAPSYQTSRDFHHFLGRIMPSAEKFEPWNQMSRVGKLAWYWSALNAQVFAQLEAIPKTHWRVEKLEELSYERYLDIAQFIGFQPTVTQEDYEKLTKRPPNAKKRVPSSADWNSSEAIEFESEVASMATRLGYEYRVRRLQDEEQAKVLMKPSADVASRQNLVKAAISKIEQALTKHQ